MKGEIRCTTAGQRESLEHSHIDSSMVWGHAQGQPKHHSTGPCVSSCVAAQVIRKSLNEPILARLFQAPPGGIDAVMVHLELSMLGKAAIVAKGQDVQAGDLTAHITRAFKGQAGPSCSSLSSRTITGDTTSADRWTAVGVRRRESLSSSAAASAPACQH